MTKKPQKLTKKISSQTIEKTAQIPSEKVKKIKIRMIGIGGGAGAIISEIASRMPKATFVAANTDLKALKTVGRKILRFPFGQNLTRGLGTGMNVGLGREAALAEKDKIKKLLENQDLCIFVACLGGGVGSGATPIFAKIAKKLGSLTYGIFTLPFKFEGEKKMEIAKASLKKIKSYLNVFSIIPNERVFQIIDKETPLKQALSTINKTLSKSLGGLIETIYEPGLINIDFADFKTILEGRGRLAYLNTADVQRKKSQAQEGSIGEILNSPFYPYTIRGAKGVMFNIGGEKNLSLAEVNQISKTISELASPEAKIIFGISQGQKHSNVIRTTLLATGCGLKIFPPKQKKTTIRPKAEVLAARKALAPRTNPSVSQGADGSLKIKITEEKIVGKKSSSPSKLRQAEKKKKRDLPLRKKTKKTIKSEPKTKKTGMADKSKPKEKLSLVSETDLKQNSLRNNSEETVRKNALQIKKEAEEIEKEMLTKEQFWETPSFLRRKLEKG